MYQQILLVGNVGDKDSELRYTPSGKPVASFSMATNRTWTNTNGEKQSKSTWWRITAWDHQAEVVAEYVKARMKVMVIGEIEEARPYTDSSGNAKASLEVRAMTIKFLSGRDDTSEAAIAERVSKRVAADDPSIPF